MVLFVLGKKFRLFCQGFFLYSFGKLAEGVFFYKILVVDNVNQHRILKM